MTLDEFGAALAAAAPGQVFETAAPKGLAEYAVWHEYGASGLLGDDTVQLEAAKVQIDVIWQSDRKLVQKIKAALKSMALPYRVEDLSYDDEWASMRCILQLEVP